MRLNMGRKRLCVVGVGLASVAAVAVTGAFGGSGSGTITTIAGTGKLGFSGDGGTAIQAKLFYPTGIAVDRVGNVYIADRGNGRVRKVTPGGKITTIAGNGNKYAGNTGDGGPAIAAGVIDPHDVAVDAKGNVYVTSSWMPSTVRKISPGGTITAFAGGFNSAPGSGSSSYVGPATGAHLGVLDAVAVDQKGNIYIS